MQVPPRSRSGQRSGEEQSEKLIISEPREPVRLCLSGILTMTSLAYLATTIGEDKINSVTFLNTRTGRQPRPKE